MAVIPYPKVNGTVSQLTNVSNTSVFRSPFTGAIKTQGRGGDHMRILLTHTNRAAADRRAIDSYISALQGQANRTALRDHAYSGPAGSLTIAELLDDPNMLDLTSWQSGANSDIRLVSNGLRFEQTNGAAVDDVRQNPEPLTVTSGLYYALVVELAGGYLPTGTQTQQVRLGTTTGASNIGSAATAAGVIHGRIVAAGAAAGASLYPSFSPSANDLGQYIDYATASVSRCLVVNGGSQTGHALNVSGFDVSTDGQLLAGDQFEIDSQLKVLAADVDSDASGNGRLTFNPPLRTSPASGAAVVLHRPHGQFLLANNETQRTNKIGGVADYAIEFIEDIAV